MSAFFKYLLGLAIAFSTVQLVAGNAHAQEQEPNKQQQAAVSVYITKNGQQQRLDFAESPNLISVYQAAMQSNLLPFTPYWPTTRLVSANKQEQVKQQQQQLIDQLEQLASYWQTANQPELAASASTVAAQVASWPLIGAEFVGRIDTAVTGMRQSGIDTVEPALYAYLDQVRISNRISINNNPYLPAGGYSFLISSEHAQGAIPNWYVVGAVKQIIEAPYIVDLSVRDMAKKVRLNEFSLSGANNSYLWQINLAGAVQQVPMAYYNAGGEKAIVGGIWVVGFQQKQLPEQFKQINQQLAELAKYWNVAL
ncbi:MAG: capsule biosynthesis GfcC D2 domain-containing protein [Idiomarina sp.]